MRIYAFPGQGSQARGMGKGLFELFPDLMRVTDEILGYSIAELCLADAKRQLALTQFTQPALFVVNALSLLKRRRDGEAEPDYLIGYSLGEYNALLAAGVFDFETGLRLVKRRGELMSAAPPGGMAAVMGIEASEVVKILRDCGFGDLDIANYNGPKQTVISGPAESIARAEARFGQPGVTYIVLNVSAPFHSRYMAYMVDEFKTFLAGVRFAPLQRPVVANVSARSYEAGTVAECLAAQICGAVRWTDTVRYLMGKGPLDLVEIGPGKVLTSLAGHIVKNCAPLRDDAEEAAPPKVPDVPERRGANGTRLGSSPFKEEYGLRYAYMAGAMGDGITSTQVIGRLSAQGLLGMLGSDGLSVAAIEKSIDSARAAIRDGGLFGLTVRPRAELGALVDLLLRKDVTVIEATGFTEAAEALVRYRLHALSSNAHGPRPRNRVIARVSRLDQAAVFLSPAPERVVSTLLERREITAEQARDAQAIPFADDIVADCDPNSLSGEAPLSVLVPSFCRLRDAVCARQGYRRAVRVGAAGGIGTPKAAAAAFVLGAEFVVAGSINQCTVEAATCDAVKDMLQELEIQDTIPVPAEDGFESGTRTQAMSKGVFFPGRANRLYELWRQHADWRDVDAAVRRQIETRFFQQSFEDIDVRERAHDGTATGGRHEMARVFKWYLRESRAWALTGEPRHRLDFQVRTGPAMGAFNEWVKDTEQRDWRRRHVDHIAISLLDETARLLS